MMIYHQYKMPTHSLSCPYRLMGTSYAGQWQCLFSFFSVFSAVLKKRFAFFERPKERKSRLAELINTFENNNQLLITRRLRPALLKFIGRRVAAFRTGQGRFSVNSSIWQYHPLGATFGANLNIVYALHTLYP